MTEMLLDDTRRKLKRVRTVIAVLVAVSAGGLFDPTAAFFALLVNVGVWACWYATVSHEIGGVRKLEMTRRAIEKRVRDD